MKILFIGDIFGKPGRSVVETVLPRLKKKYKIELSIANCENLTQGRGITKKTILQMKNAGIDVFTSGNHLWDKRESIDFISTSSDILKPANYPKATPGARYTIFKSKNGEQCAVITILGQIFMKTYNINRPVYTMDRLLKKELFGIKNIFVDFHAEATAEKRAFAEFYNGKITAVVGTHTHVQTADEQILTQGTAFITDVGMTGGHNSVIGVKKEIIIKTLETSLPQRFIPSDKGLQLNAVFIEISGGKAIKIKRILKKYD